MDARSAGAVEETLSVVAAHYMELNPRAPVTFRAFSKNGIQRAADYRYEVDFNEFFPDARNEECVFSCAKMWAEEGDLMFDLNCYGPLILLLNGEEVWRSNIFTERYPERSNRITLPLKEGWNQFVICARKTRGGFGWKFGSWIGKHPYVFMMPTAERDGQEGWIFTHPLSPETMLTAEEFNDIPDTQWNPVAQWPKEALKLGNCARIFGQRENAAALGWTKVENRGVKPISTWLTGSHMGAVSILCNGEEIYTAPDSGLVRVEHQFAQGTHDLMVLSTSAFDGWGFDLKLEGAETICPCALQGRNDVWLFAGPFAPNSLPEFTVAKNFHTIFDTLTGPGYWRLDAPECYVRLYNENPLFGQWNYPLGVTLYGLLHAALALESEPIKRYVRDHVQFCCSTWPYAQWDRDTFGGATHVHPLLSSIDSLDDCGSFGSCMLEAARHCDISGFEPIANLVGDYISNQQDRFEDGAFQRRDMMHAFHNQTMWADDLYMSVPFLCRYYQLTGERRYIDDAANQFFGFKKRLYMPEQRLMSHVYDIGREMATGVPWSRANGWTLFSLSELLEVLPEDHPSREKLIEFFQEMCAGVLAMQDDEGMWHQVLTHPGSYPETSCTSMFIYAFSRGIRFGWLDDLEVYAAAVRKAWAGINRISIDQDGNVYGVCRGSEFSFTPDYYINDLTWRLNDTHGMGIVLLAGVEMKKLTEFLRG